MANILIIEDNEVVRLTLRMMLEEEKHTVYEAADGMEGITAFTEHHCDVIITDMRMPGMDGPTFIDHIRQLPHAPGVIAVSGGDAGDDPEVFIAEAKAAGADAALRKPVKMDELLSTIDALL